MSHNLSDVLAAMERVVAEATPGPWFHRQANETLHGKALDWIADSSHHGQHRKIILNRDALYGGAADYAYLVRFDPPTLTALLAVVKAAIADGHAADNPWHHNDTERCPLCDALDALTRPPQGAGNGCTRTLDRMIFLDGAKQSFRCDCGGNVFKEYAPGKFRCNSCEATYTGER